jgi:aspyridone synthetase (hybrid polyketide synthase/nonribosomal peptide synthetase)
MMRRTTNDVEAFSGGIGYIWSYLGESGVNFDSYRQAFEPIENQEPQMVKNLPPYSWDHERLYWQESRISQNYRLRDHRPHELLGRRASDDSEYELRWQNVLRLNELPWLKDHVFQGQAIFPAAGYVAMAIEAAGTIAAGRLVTVIEMTDFVLPKALVVEDDQKGVETIFTVKRINGSNGLKDLDDSIYEAEFACYICPLGATGRLEKTCSGKLIFCFGQPSIDELPARSVGSQQLSPINVDRFYNRLLSLGLNYQGAFRGTTSAQRSTGCASASASWHSDALGDQYMIHPAVIDVAFQSVFAAIASPESDALWSPYLPVGISRLIFNPSVSFDASDRGVTSHMTSFLTQSSVSLIEGDIHVSNHDGNVGIQIEGLILKSFTEPSASSDRLLFSEQIWDLDIGSGFDGLVEEQPNTNEAYLVDAIERTALYYFKSVFSGLSQEEVSRFTWYHQRMFETVDEILLSIRNGRHPTAKKEWLDDSRDSILALKQQFQGQIDIELMHAIGENLPAVLRSETQLLEVMLENDMLNRLYMEGRSFVPLNKYIARVAQKVTFKHPRMKILEIGAGTGGTTRSVLDSIGDAYSTYTYTDISSAFFEKAAEKFSDHRGKIDFRVLDIEKDVVNQGFKEQSYDTIIAANVLHATRSLQETMQHVRKLLKPGGYLILMEVTGNLLVLPFVMGGLPGWWLGVDEGRRSSPGISPMEWDTLLRSTGFTGVDKVLHDVPDSVKHSCSVIVSQAENESFQLLREPLSSPLSILGKEPILIIGGKTLTVAKLVRDTQKLLSPWKVQTTVVDDLHKLSGKLFSSSTSVICLLELDSPLFSGTLTMEEIVLLQELFTKCTNILWVTTGRLDRNPHSNMTIGVGRAVAAEVPQLNLQFLDVDALPSLDGRTLLEAFLRLALINLPEFTEQNMVWTREPEIAIIAGSVHLPRVIPNMILNNRLNGLRRNITKRVDTGLIPVELVVSGALASLHTKPPLGQLPSEHEYIDVEYSLILPAGKYLCLGGIRANGSKAVAFSSSHTSTIKVPSDDIFLLEKNQNCDPATLRGMANHLIAAALIMDVPNTGSTVVYEADSAFAETIMHNDHWRDRHVHFVTSKSPSRSDSCIYIHPRSSRGYITEVIPKDTTCLIDLTVDGSQSITSALPESCSIRSLGSISWGWTRAIGFGKQLELSFYEATSSPAPESTMSIVPIQQAEKDAAPLGNYPDVIDWTQSEFITARIEPFNAVNLFSGDKTYFLVGLTSELGLSLCAWMVRNGARYLALTSRSAIIDESWLIKMRGLGAHIKVYKMDVSNRAAVHSVYSDICSTMPVIGGVCNAAMVLHDKLFVDMDEDIMNNTLRPKVEGTKHLDELFSNSSLEFFILFSSLGSVVGNGGQSNYHAANLFLESLAAGRRAKGLVASVISIGMVVDVGYIARTGEALIDRLRKLFYMPLSETDIHHLFGEAIIASTSGSTMGADIIMGLEPFTDSPNAKSRPPWYLNPRFSHFIRDADKSSTKQQSTLSVLNLKDQLENAITEEATTHAIQASFSQKLESMLQLGSNTINCNMPLLDLGMDSLLAVEIRTWFLKEVHVDIPVLKLLSGDTVAEISIEAARIFLTFKLEKSPLPKKEPTLEHDKSPLPNTTDEAGNYSNSENEQSVEPETPNTSPPISSPQYSSQASVHTDCGDEVSGCGGNRETSGLVQEEEFTRLELMSAPQSRIWFMQNYQDYPTAYNITISYLVEGNLDIEKFHRALVNVVARHGSFRTCFFEQSGSGNLMQGLSIRSPDCLKIIQTASDEDVAQELERYRSRVWDLVRAETFQATLILKSSGSHEIIFGYHHIIMDGISWHLFLQELNAAYQMLPLRPVKTQCFDFSVEQQFSIQNGTFEAQINFWKEMHSPLPDIMPLLPFAKLKSRIASNHNHIQTSLHELDADHTRKIKLAAQALRVTPFHFYLSAMQVFFSKLLDLEDICIGVTDANRNVAGYGDTIGYFLNMMALRFQIDRNEQFSKLAKRTAQKVYAASENSGVPFDLILERLDLPRSSAHTPLFQVALNYRMGDLAEVSLGDCKLRYSSVEEASNPYDLAFNITQTQTGSCVIQVTSQAHLYTPEATQLILDLFVYLLDDISSDTSLQISKCRLYNQDKAESSLTIGRGVRMSSGWPDTLSERFNMVQTQFADEVAVKDDTGSITYKQLAALSNNIAGSLLALDLPVGSVIGVLCEPSIRTIASLLAIIHIGCVYVPLDLSLPRARLSVMVEDCQPKVIICEDCTLESAKQMGNPEGIIFNVSSIKPDVRIPVEARGLSAAPAFLLYTSGSTGVPKGIVLSQAGFINYLAAKSQTLSLGREVVLQQSSFGFDMSIAQVFNALGHGGTLVIVPSRIRGDPVEIAKLMLIEKVSFTIATPSEYLSLLIYGREYLTPSWRHACCGGEVVSEQLKREFRNASPITSPRITNCYGPTEISAATSFQHVSLASANSSTLDEYSCVGQAIPNTSIYIVNDKCQLVPSGFPGEICIGGAGLAIGYFKETPLNQTKFLQDPFALPEDVARGWTMMHKTGDQGILNSDGSLLFIGRKDGDTQVKLRGLRIDFGDVANALLDVSRGLLTDAIVTLRDDSLVAHVVVAQGEVVSDLQFQSLVRNLPLPQYMHPAMVVRLDRLPTNANGKTDRKAIESLRLPSPTSAARSRLSLLEGELRLIWLETLPQASASHLDAQSDFFMLGGNSFLLVKLQSGINVAMGVRIPLQQLYASSSLGAMAELVGNGRSQLLPVAAIDWDLETKFEIQSSSVPNYSTRTMKDRNQNVLLTGASSFLGNAILNALLEDPRVGKVFCIALSEDHHDLLPTSQKIVPCTGNLLIPNFGLSKSQMAELASTVDLILHAGSIGHCLNNYSSVQFPNVQSTRSLANLALIRKVPFHFISSNRVTLLSGHTSMPPISVSTHRPPTDGTEGLTASKWASERFLENVACATQLEVCVHRPCATTGDSAPADDALTSLLRFSSLMKAVPVFENMQGFLDFKDVDSVASDITREVLSTTDITPESSSFRVRHHSSKIRVPVGQIRQHLEKMYDSDFEELSLSEWIERATPLGIDGLVTSYLEAVVAKNGPMLFPYLGEKEL